MTLEWAMLTKYCQSDNAPQPTFGIYTLDPVDVRDWRMVATERADVSPCRPRYYVLVTPVKVPLLLPEPLLWLLLNEGGGAQWSALIPPISSTTSFAVGDPLKLSLSWNGFFCFAKCKLIFTTAEFWREIVLNQKLFVTSPVHLVSSWIAIFFFMYFDLHEAC